MSNWQPIDTAPKDGREVLGFGALLDHAEGKKILLPMRWEQSGNGAGVPGFAVRITDHIFAPTHWMPLPDPLLSGMPRWLVRLGYRYTADVTVEAISREEAIALAKKEAESRELREEFDAYTGAHAWRIP